MDPERPFRIVTGVLREALRNSDRKGVVVAGGGPELRLLSEWIQRAGIPWEVPPPELVRGARALLDQGGAPVGEAGRAGRTDPTVDPGEEAAVWAATGLAGSALARGRHALLVGTESKTCLLLGYHPTGASILPLGDLYASEILAMAGGCTAPNPLRSYPPSTLLAVDRALRSHFEEGAGEETAFRNLPSPLRDAVGIALDRARGFWRPAPLIPKMGSATLGIDLDL